MSPTPQVRASAYFPFVQFLEAIGAPVARSLEKELVPVMAAQDEEALVPVHAAHLFLHNAARLAGISDLGFVVGSQVRVEDLGAFGRSLRRSLTLHDALGKLQSNFALYSSAEKIWWYRSTHKIYICHEYIRKSGPGGRYGQQCALLLLRDLVRLAAGPNWQPAEVLLTNPSLDAAAMHRVFEGAQIQQATHCGFAFPAELLRRPFQFSAGLVRDDGFDPTPFEASAPASDFTGSIRQVISALMRQGQCELAQIAHAVGMHPRTLQRRLANAQEEFSELLSRVRYETALRLLEDPDQRVIDIACELGYTDSSNFTRAFRSWTGVAPSYYRKLPADRRTPDISRAVAK